MEDLVTDISDADFLKGANAEMNLWIRNVRNATNSKTHEEVTKEKLMRQTKETLVKCLLEGYQTVSSNNDKFESSRDCVELLKSCGYFVSAQFGSPEDWGIPQTRKRV